jgi:hypothetical protein
MSPHPARSAVLAELMRLLRSLPGATTVKVTTSLGSRHLFEIPPLADPDAGPEGALTATVATPAPARPARPFVPNPFQHRILEALDGRALRTDALGDAVDDRRRLFRPGGLKELQAEGLVNHHDRLGYYRPGAPPATFAGDPL